MSVSIVPALAAQADVYARALDARDARFDGVFFVGIITTRIYCRPVCPARVSYHDHRRFFHSAAAAEREGFRPCMRCRPELAPGLALVDAVSRLARDAVNRIAAGALNGHSVAELARDLGVSERHLRRALEREVGASPLELAQTHRLLLAKRLLADTGLAITRIAYASGFQSLRRFNAAFRTQYRMAPSALRGGSGKLAEPTDNEPVRLSLAYRSPFAWNPLLGFLRQDAVDGIEVVDERRYGRTVEVEGHTGFVFIENAGARGGGRETAPANAGLRRARRLTKVSTGNVSVAISPSLVPALMPLLARLRYLFDLDAEPTVIDAHLGQGSLGGLVARRPGVRIPGAFDGFDVALRAILRGRARGNRVGAASGDLPARVAAALGEPIETGIPSLSRLAPTAARVADAGVGRLQSLGVPRRRATAAITVAELVADRKLVLSPGSDPIATRRLLTEIDGIGDQLALVIVMRTLSWPDALPAADSALQRAANVSSPGALEALGEQWRPWRTYAALNLWLEDEAPR
ncbi:MAG TPA: AlkA N-terminal domain-containing protein [Gemmatimonadaceae bacterium]|nr:AlkA N-terminal domain-containing protein [Gemmatimonadaceae bacterium]